MLLAKFDVFHEHAIWQKNTFREKVEKTLKSLNLLERHFRMALAYLERNRAIKKRWNDVLGPE